MKKEELQLVNYALPKGMRIACFSLEFSIKAKLTVVVQIAEIVPIHEHNVI